MVATHGRSFWILDNLSPLRELNSTTAAASVYLFHPATAIRLRKNEARDTPLEPETPVGKNPPAGAIIDFSLQTIPTGAVTLEIMDSKGALVSKYSSSDAPGKIDETQSFPTYWFNPPAPLSKHLGLNRFVWDLRYERPRALRFGYSIAAAYGDDAIMQPEGPLRCPAYMNCSGRLTVKHTPRHLGSRWIHASRLQRSRCVNSSRSRHKSCRRCRTVIRPFVRFAICAIS